MSTLPNPRAPRNGGAPQQFINDTPNDKRINRPRFAAHSLARRFDLPSHRAELVATLAGFRVESEDRR